MLGVGQFFAALCVGLTAFILKGRTSVGGTAALMYALAIRKSTPRDLPKVLRALNAPRGNRR